MFKYALDHFYWRDFLFLVWYGFFVLFVHNYFKQQALQLQINLPYSVGTKSMTIKWAATSQGALKRLPCVVAKH